ncbi:MAG: hypothetical protein ABIR62_13440 [Dokdonella sp.]|uniref:hypothetical protein n=1 Tax=Dokdonella sp. TaxID=2291710 RepID=UPI00326401E5
MTSGDTTPPGDWLELPRATLHLLATYWPTLVFWFFVQKLAGMILLRLAVVLGYVNHLLGFLGLALMVVVRLLCTIAMFDALRSAVLATPEVADAKQEHADSGAGSLRRFGSVLAIVLLPFFAYYATWGLLGDSIRAYVLDFLRGSLLDRHGLPTDLLQEPGLWLSVVLTYALRRGLLWWQQAHPAALWSILATTCQAYWVFLGLYVIRHWTDAAWAWAEQRVAWAWVSGWWADLVDAVPAAPPAAGVAGALPSGFSATLHLAGPVLQALLLTLVWFAIAAIVYGRDLGTARALFRADARLEFARRRFAALPVPVRHTAGKILDKTSAGWNSKAVPVINAVRLLLAAGVRPMLALCVGYVALDVVCDLAWRAVATLIGPHEGAAWEVFGSPLAILFGGPLDLESSLLGEPVRICLLAAAVRLAMQRGRRQRSSRAVSVVGSEDSGVVISAG